MEIKRYDIEACDDSQHWDCCSPALRIEQDADGQWVRHADHLAAREAEIERLNGLLAERKGCDLPQGCCDWCGVAKEARYERDCIRQVLDSMMGVVCRPLNLNPASVSENDVRAGMDSLVHERDALRAELVATLRESVGQGCYLLASDTLDSMGTSVYADQLRRLAELGQVDIISDDGRRVVARWRVCP